MKKRERIEERYRKNRDLLPDYREYIFDQNDARVRSLRFGEKYSVGDNGCGAVAVHNAMKYIGKEQDFCDVLRDMEALRMIWLGGAFGTKPWSPGRYFRQKNILYRKYKSPNDFKAALLTNDIGIVCTWNRRFQGMHFYCAYYSLEENKYYSANFRSGGNDFRPMTLDEINSARFIVGYTLKKA